MNASEIMVQPVQAVGLRTSLEEIARLMLGRGFGCVPVVDEEGRLCGIVTESDFAAKDRGVPFSTLRMPQVFNEWMPPRNLERLYERARALTAEDVMSREVAVATPETPVEEVVRMMLDRDISHVPVTRDEVPVGMISRHDLLRMMIPEGR